MSCTSGDGTSCDDVLAQVWLFLDHECDQQRRDLLARHLDECEPCLAEYGLEEKIKALLAAKCGGDKAPHALKDRLRQQIRTTVLEQAQVTVETSSQGTRTTVVRATRIERHQTRP